jgi:V-type H+-transporting ATPase subunit a
MSLGILMKAFNAVYFKRGLDFWFEFLPQLILLWVLFGWMDLLIIIKWLTPWQGDLPPGDRLDTSQAPAIISIMINMFLKFGDVPEEEGTYLVGSPSGQQTISIILLVVALLSVPTMLCVKPCVLKQRMKRAHVRQGS